jgi:hypothetical protein
LQVELKQISATLFVDVASADSTDTTGGYTFSDALHAVSTIEHQCTREGIKALLDRSVNNTPTNINIDINIGTLASMVWDAGGDPRGGREG